MFEFGVSNIGRNGFMNMVMQNDADIQAAFAEFDKRVEELGHVAHPALLFQEVLDDMFIREKDLTHMDKERIKRKIESVSKGGLNYD